MTSPKEGRTPVECGSQERGGCGALYAKENVAGTGNRDGELCCPVVDARDNSSTDNQSVQ